MAGLLAGQEALLAERDNLERAAPLGLAERPLGDVAGAAAAAAQQASPEPVVKVGPADFLEVEAAAAEAVLAPLERGLRVGQAVLAAAA